MAIEFSSPMLTENRGKTLAVVVGGGPAPGINGVIRAVTLEALRRGLRVIGILDGFKWLAQGKTDRICELTELYVARIHLQGGSVIGTSREAPAKDERKLTHTINALRELKVDYLVTIGGDDTASTASRIGQLTGKEIEIVHVPKTIDNDLPLPSELPTFGYQTARQVGTSLLANLMEDARTTGRWYFIIAMGRTAGHLALGMGKAAGCDATIIPEEFRGKKVRLGTIGKILEGAILKNLVHGKSYGVAIIAEGTAELIDETDLAEIKNVERDEHGHVRLAELPFGQILKDAVRKSLAEFGVKVTIVDKNIGYELRCAPPIANDLEYTQDLGYAAVQFLRSGNAGSLVCVKGAELLPLKLNDLLDPQTGKMRVRRVDVDSNAYALARCHMNRLTPDDFKAPVVTALSHLLKFTPAQFTERYREQQHPW